MLQLRQQRGFAIHKSHLIFDLKPTRGSLKFEVDQGETASYNTYRPQRKVQNCNDFVTNALNLKTAFVRLTN